VTNPVIGDWLESPTAPVYNSGFRDALAEKNIMVLTAGHDHANDYCMLDEMNENRNEKTWMCYGGGIGYGGYGGYGGYKRRARVFEVPPSHPCCTRTRLMEVRCLERTNQNLETNR